MVCSSSDSEGRSLKVLSSRPGASREKRRARWGRGVASSGSAVLAGVQGWRGPSAPVESVTAGFSEMLPLFWVASASSRPAQKQQGSHHNPAAQRALSRRSPPTPADDLWLPKWNRPHRDSMFEQLKKLKFVVQKRTLDFLLHQHKTETRVIKQLNLKTLQLCF